MPPVSPVYQYYILLILKPKLACSPLGRGLGRWSVTRIRALASSSSINALKSTLLPSLHELVCPPLHVSSSKPETSVFAFRTGTSGYVVVRIWPLASGLMCQSDQVNLPVFPVLGYSASLCIPLVRLKQQSASG